jgi:hypothetical protein
MNLFIALVGIFALMVGGCLVIGALVEAPVPLIAGVLGYRLALLGLKFLQ